LPTPSSRPVLLSHAHAHAHGVGQGQQRAGGQGHEEDSVASVNVIDRTDGNTEVEQSGSSHPPPSASHYAIGGRQAFNPFHPHPRSRKTTATSISPSLRPPLRHQPSQASSGHGKATSTREARAAAKSRQTSVKTQNPKKRRHIIAEFISTERAYVKGLDLIYEHFLLPILDSLEESERAVETTAGSGAANGGQAGEPILSRKEVALVFSNFIDIWNLHGRFLEALEGWREENRGILTAAAEPTTPAPTPAAPTPTASGGIKESERAVKQEDDPRELDYPLAMVLNEHFPYLSLYTPFVTSFPTTLALLSANPGLPSSPSSLGFHHLTGGHAGGVGGGGGEKEQLNKRFYVWLREREKDVRCGRLRLSNWMLTIVQRSVRSLALSFFLPPPSFYIHYCYFRLCVLSVGFFFV
jgi:FYVE, RhoGEF and PH domain containing 5/6